MYDTQFAVEYVLPVTKGEPLKITSVIRYKDFSLSGLIRQAKAAIYSRMYGLRANGKYITPVSSLTIEWDASTKGLPEAFQRQQEMANRTYSASKEVLAEGAIVEKEPALLEVKKVNGVWTIIPHEKPLMTWAEACALLKEKVDGNEKI